MLLFTPKIYVSIFQNFREWNSILHISKVVIEILKSNVNLHKFMCSQKEFHDDIYLHEPHGMAWEKIGVNIHL